MKTKLSVVTLCLLLLVGCAHKANTTPQYQAAVANDNFSIGLRVFCTQEINFKPSIPFDVHKTIQQKCLQIATLDKQITNSIVNNDFKSASGYIDLAKTAVTDLGPDLLNIKDKTTQQALQIAQTGALSLLTSWQIVVNNQTTGGTK